MLLLGLINKTVSHDSPEHTTTVCKQSLLCSDFTVVPHHYIVFDIETTGFSRHNDRIIEIAANEYVGGKLVKSFHTYVNPNRPIPSHITHLTGIKDADVQNAPSIFDIKRDLLTFFDATILVGHNIKSFDIPFLEAQLNCSISNDYIDTLFLAKQVFPNLPSYKLSVLNQILQLGGIEHHRAANDIVVNNALLLACTTPQKYQGRISNTEILQGIKTKKCNYTHASVDLHAIIPTSPNLYPNGALAGKNIVFTGTLSIPRDKAMQFAVDSGAILKSSVSKKTNYLVVGKQDKALVGEDGMSTKEECALALNQSGKANIKIITENEFFALINNEEVFV